MKQYNSTKHYFYDGRAIFVSAHKFLKNPVMLRKNINWIKAFIQSHFAAALEINYTTKVSKINHTIKVSK